MFSSDPYLISAPGMIRTCDLRIRSPMLYPAELRGLVTTSLPIQPYRHEKLRCHSLTTSVNDGAESPVR